jgi:hypothetical protein
LFVDDVAAHVDAFVADEHMRAGNQLVHFMLAFATEGAIEDRLRRWTLLPDGDLFTVDVGNPQHAEVQSAMQDAVKRLRALGKPAGILTGNEDEARRYIDWGYLFVAVGADVGLLARNADALAKKFKGG